MNRSMLLWCCVSSVAASAQVETFHGWSKDGSYLAYQAPGNNDIIELFFCQTDASVNPTWPASLKELDRVEEHGLSCVRFIDRNKAPYEWKNALVLPAAAMRSNGVALLAELVTDGETPGFVLEAGGKRQHCYVSGLKEDSKLQKAWWHPSGRFMAALVDGRFLHCAVTIKGAKSVAPAKKK